MRVVTPKAIYTYAAAHPDAATSLDLWLQTTKRATWKNLAEVRNDFRHADLLGRRTIFNIAGNNIRSAGCLGICRLVGLAQQTWHPKNRSARV